jgi:hypothetical protein
MQCIERYEAIRAAIWPEVERFFQALPPDLSEPAWHFAQRLARSTSPTHAFRDTFKKPWVARIVYLPLWHIDAYLGRGIQIPRREALQTNLFTAAFMGFCAIRIHDDLVDKDTPCDEMNDLLLADLFIVEAIRRLQRLFPAESPLWDYHAQYWQDYISAVRADQQRNRRGIMPFDEHALRQIGQKAALLNTFPTAVALWASQPYDIEPLTRMMEAFNTAVQLVNDLYSLPQDLEAQHYTPPIVQAALMAGFEAGTHPSVEELYGAVVLTDGVAHTCALALQYYERAFQISVSLGIDSLTEHLAWAMEEVRTLQTQPQHPSRVQSQDESQRSTEPWAPVTVTKPDSLKIALDFMQYDPEYREAWECQRTGTWGQSLLVSNAFGRSLILEVLAEYGCDVSAQIEALLAQYRQDGWRYYRGFKALPPDIDDIAQSMHLLQWTGWETIEKSRYLQRLLEWLTSNQTPDGGFPVWLTEHIEDQPVSGWVPLAGDRCLACEANLLFALEGVSALSEHEWITAGMASLLDRWERQRFNAVFYYTPAYTTFLIARCLGGCLSSPDITSETGQRLQTNLRGMMETIIEPALKNAQTAAPFVNASMLLAYLCSPEPDSRLVDSALSILERQQDHDGGWGYTGSAGFFRCLGRRDRRIAWHQSRLLTTAVAARALIWGRAWRAG